MQLQFRVKKLGKKKPVIDNLILDIQIQEKPSLRQFVTAVVQNQVQAFNERVKKPALIPFLLDGDIDEQAGTGKIGFANKYNTAQQNEEEAIENALLSFQDGLYAVFNGDQQIKKMDQVMELSEQTPITFIRLTFLTGSIF